MANTKKQLKRKYHIVYQTKNIVNGMIYVGAHSTDIIEDGYLGSGFRLILAIEKYGKELFFRTVQHIYNNPIDMFDKEKEIVNPEFLKRNDVYNIVEGGYGGFNKGTTGLKHLQHPILKKRCAVHPNVIPNMLNEGWVLGRGSSSTTGTIWIHKGKDKKMIVPNLLVEYVSNGWMKGLPNSPTGGKIWIYNQTTGEYSLCESLSIPAGWIKKKWSPVKRGTKWINNGAQNLRLPLEDITSYLNQGWKFGALQKH
jgi:hypothetical protein